jgi:hypothetical protein
MEKSSNELIRLARPAPSLAPPRPPYCGWRKRWLGLDVLSGLAELAVERQYRRPEVCDDPVLKDEDGRHPVLDRVLPPGATWRSARTPRRDSPARKPIK